MVNVIDDTEPIDISLIYLFGDTNNHAESQTVEGYILGMKAQMGPINGTAEKITVRLGRNETFTTKCALYRVSDNTLIGGTQEKIIPTGESWVNYVFNEPKPQLIADEMYYICVWAEPNDVVGKFCSMKYEENIYDPGTWFRAQDYGPWPNIVPFTEWGTRTTMSIYCTYNI